MQLASTGEVRCEINVTPLVDVVLVLLIIFMVIAPQLAGGPAMQLPVTERPPQQQTDARQVLVAIEHSGTMWVGASPVSGEALVDTLRAAAAEQDDPKVVVKGDARLTFGEVRRAVRAVEAAGFEGVGLIAERREEAGRGLHD